MELIRPFRGLRATAASAPELAAPPYDVVTAPEVSRMCGASSRSFLHVTRPDAAFPGSTGGEDALALARQFLDRRVADGDLVVESEPIYCVIRMSARGHTQTGLVAAIPTAACDDGRVRRHELIHEDKCADRARHILALRAHTGLVMLMHRPLEAATRILSEITSAPADAVSTTIDGVEHSLWVVREPSVRDAVSAAYASLDALYIADGHHRSAAAARIADGGPGAFPGVLFAAPQMRVLGYHRLIVDTGGVAPATLRAALERDFVVQASERGVLPQQPNTVGLRLPEGWYTLVLRTEPAIDTTPAGLIDSLVLQPLLGIDPASRGRRIRYVGGEDSVDEIDRQVESGAAAAAFTLAPVDGETIMRIADAGELLPQKSTWFEPKLADGLVVLPLDEDSLADAARPVSRAVNG